MSNLSGRGQLTGVMRSGGGSSGGSEVIINPSGAAIGTMEKISVDGNIYEVRNVPDAASASNGDILTRTDSGVGWYPPTKELPVYTSSDNNKFLKIVNDSLIWAEVASGANVTEKLQSEYDELTTEEKRNGSIYMVKGEENYIGTQYNMSNGTKYGEGNMSFTASSTKVISAWDGGGSIGGDWRFTNPIDVTDLKSINFEISTRTCYAHTSSNVEEQTTERFINTVYLFRTLPDGYGYDNESNAIDMLKFKYTNTNYGAQSFDVSNLTGDIYVVWASTGWNATLSNLKTIKEGDIINRIYFMGTEYANTKVGE